MIHLDSQNPLFKSNTNPIQINDLFKSINTNFTNTLLHFLHKNQYYLYSTQSNKLVKFLH